MTRNASYLPGDVVRTAYGAGVLVAAPAAITGDGDPRDGHNPSGDGVAVDSSSSSSSSSSPSVASNTNSSSSFVVRLWRIPGRSISSSAVAYMAAESILGKLPAAPGMITTIHGTKEPKQRVRVYTHSPTDGTFLVSPVDDQEGGSTTSQQKQQQQQQQKPKSEQWMELPVETLDQAPSAKFYPLLHELMRRGDMTAVATSQLLRDEKLTNVVKKSTELLESSTEEAANAVIASTEKVSQLTTSAKELLPDEKGVKEVYNMLKDEELTVLLQKGQERLQQLMSTVDVSKATQLALDKAGIAIASDGDDDDDDDGDGEAGSGSSFERTIAKSRKTALKAMEQLLEDVDVHKEDIQGLRDRLETQFASMFDSLSEAAQSDRTLNTIWQNISGKTSDWQMATGRLMSTKSGSLFVEGATRLRARAAHIFNTGHGQLNWWADEVGSQFTKAFTEGDAALARLKSLELGDAVRHRLIAAIELRSGSYGGLDGIIAGALTTVGAAGPGEESGEHMQSMLAKLRTTASSATTDAHETLISVLSRRNEYQDVALLRIETVLCDLESHLLSGDDGDDGDGVGDGNQARMTAEQIAAIARGEGGTAALFEPIAKRASKEIQKLLDQTESSVEDPTILAGLRQIRKIVSGELTLDGLMDEVINMLNDDQVVAAGENIVQSGENVLDAIEGISSNEVVGNVMQMAEKAGITKETLMSQMEQLDVNEILDTAGNAVTDEKARRELVSSATDTALDFMLRILPSMPVPPFDGVREGLVYHLSNLSMAGFKVKKEDIMVEIAGMRATKRIQAEKKPDEGRPKWLETTADTDVPKWLQEETKAEASDVTSALAPPETKDASGGDDILDVHGMDGYEEKSDRRKATELLIIDVRRISAVLDDTVWSFEQTYMPYLKGNGKANVKMSDGSIRLQFELRKRRKQRKKRPTRRGANKDKTNQDGADEWEPVLCLHNRSCSIEQVELVIQGGGRLTWIVNKLATIFKGPLRDYVVRTIVNTLTSKSGWILEKLNQNLAPYWGLILRTTGLHLDALIEADDRVITATLPEEDEDLVELVWREKLPLGMNLLLNDDSGLLKVVDFPRGSQARAVCGEKGVDPTIFNGATVVAVNGTKYEIQDELFEALKDPSRPKSIKFRLANQEDAERVRNFVAGTTNEKRENDENLERTFELREVVFRDDRELGIEFSSSIDDYSLVVKSFLPGPDGIVLSAEREDKIRIGDILCKVNDEFVLGDDGKGKIKALELLQKHGNERPLRLSFTDPYLHRETFDKSQSGVAEMGGPDEFVLEETKTDTTKRITLRDFKEVNGTAELGGILIGDHLVFINAAPVGAACTMFSYGDTPGMSVVYKMLQDEAMYPVALTFARPKKTESRWATLGANIAAGAAGTWTGDFRIETAETICITADCYEQLGCVFEDQGFNDIVVADLFAVPGPMQKRMRPFQDLNGRVHLSIEAINGQFVPSYASTSIVMNAMKRSWSSTGTMEIQLCDDERKAWVHSHTKS